MPVDINPFYHELHYSKYQIIKIVLMTIFVVPVRLVLVTFALSLGWVICKVTVQGLSDEELKKPLTGWRRWLQREFGPPVAQLVFFVLGFLFIRTKGQRASKKEAPVLVMAPHSSWTDALLHFLDPDITSPVSRMDNAQIPIIGTLVKFLQPVCVSRDVANSRSDCVNEIKRRATSCSESNNLPDSDEDRDVKNEGEWQQVALFPEGTTTNRKCLISFKTGAFQPGVPVQPVVVKWPNHFDCVTWAFVGPSVYKLIWLQLCQITTFVQVQYLPVYTPSDEEKSDPTLFANNVRHVMASVLNVPVTSYTYRDGVQFRRRYLASKQGWSAKIAIWNNLASKIGLTSQVLDDILKYIVQKQRSNDLVDSDWLEEVLGIQSDLPKNSDVRNALNEFLPTIHNSEGKISLEKFVAITSLWCCKQEKNLDSLKYLLTICGVDDLNHISEESVNRCVQTIFESNSDHHSKNEIITDMFKLSYVNFETFKHHVCRKQGDFLT
ncbi:lysophosphatidylcholine acyltransferase 1-like [Convolutriloba macropyga]|uniref:lysophosphatidylcholine acyltransferase 1-like n=1 Tax=Convolutriloba macropyga TaxID=536237 RepID=UPI003F5274DC